MLGLCNQRWRGAEEPGVGLYRKPSILAALGVENGLQQRSPFYGNVSDELPRDLVFGKSWAFVDKFADAIFPESHLFLEDADNNDGITGRANSSMLDGVFQFLKRGGVIPQAGRRHLRHLVERALVSCNG